MSIIDKQQQVTQLQLKFKGTLIDDMQVESVNDLLNLNINFNYEHKLVWVKNEEAYYYLYNGNGSLISHWKKFSQKLILEQYQTNKAYILGDVVYLQNKIFLAKEDILINENPIDFGNKWEVIAGDIQTSRILFIEQTSIIIYTNIKNPFFDIWEGQPEFENSTPVMDSDGLIKINNAEQTSGYIKRRSDIPDNNGKAYEILFFENNVLSPITGIINIK